MNTFWRYALRRERTKVAICLSALLLVALCFGFFQRYYHRQVVVLALSNRSQSMVLTDIQNWLTQHPDAEQYLDSLQQEHDRLLLMLPKQAQLEDFYDSLQLLAIQDQITLNSIKPVTQGDETHNGVPDGLSGQTPQEYLVSVNFYGPSYRVMSFLYHVHQSSRYNIMRSVDLVPKIMSGTYMLEAKVTYAVFSAP